MILRLLCVGTLALVGGCATTRAVVPDLADAHAVSDFGSYEFRRIGLVPFAGQDLTVESAELLQAAFYAELSRSTAIEIVPLSPADIAEVPASEPVRRGWYRPDTVLALARRFRIDGLFVGTAIDHQSFAPQRLSLQLELVAAETGLAVWTASVHLDGADPRVVKAIRERARREGNDVGGIALLSPRLFARFAAEEIARLF